MIESIEFRNFKALRDTTLRLGRFTLIVGPNGSGKSTVFQAMKIVRDSAPRTWAGPIQRQPTYNVEDLASDGNVKSPVAIQITWAANQLGQARTRVSINEQGHASLQHDVHHSPPTLAEERKVEASRALSRIRVYALDPRIMVKPTQPRQDAVLEEGGENLAGALSRLSDRFPDRFEALNAELERWIPEFDRVTFDYTPRGERVFFMRVKESQRQIPAMEVSQGTLLALALLTIAYAPDPASVVCLEEPDRGLHPRLLRDVRDAIYRLTRPEQFGDNRQPVQVIATTHSPYMLDLFREHPEEIVIAKKVGLDATFERLIDQPHYEEIIEDAHLGDLWYSGVLGGVPADK